MDSASEAAIRSTPQGNWRSNAYLSIRLVTDLSNKDLYHLLDLVCNSEFPTGQWFIFRRFCPDTSL